MNTKGGDAVDIFSAIHTIAKRLGRDELSALSETENLLMRLSKCPKATNFERTKAISLIKEINERQRQLLGGVKKCA